MAYYATPANHLATRSGRVKVNPGIVQAVIDAAQVLFESAQFMKTNERLCTQIARIATELATCLELSSQLAFDRRRDLVITPGSASVLGVTREVLLQCSIYMRQASARNILDRVLKYKETSAALNSFHAACLRLRDLVVVPQNGSGKLSLLDDHEHTHHLSLVAFIPKSALELQVANLYPRYDGFQAAMLEMIYVTSGLPYPLSAVPQVVLLIISYIKSVALEQAWASQLMAGMETQWTSIPKHDAVSGVIVADQLLQGDVRSFFNHVCHIAVRLRVLQAVQPVHLFISRGTYDAIFAQEVVNLAHASEENSAPPSVVTRLPEPFVQVPSNEEDVGVAPNEEDVGIAPNDEISNAINIILERSADSGSARMVVLAADTRRMGDALVAALLRRDPRVASHFGNQRFSVQCKTLVQPTMILELIIQMLRLPRTSNDLAVVRRHLESSPRTLLVLENLNVRRLMKARTTVNLTMLLGVLAAVQTVTLVITTLSLVLPPGIEWADGVSQPLYSLRPGETRRIFANLVAGIPSERNYNSNRHEVDHSHPHVPLQNLMTNFPTEMWACVARHCDRRSLQELSLTSKSFMHEAQRELFRELHFTGWTGSDTPTKPVAKVALARIVGLSTASSRTYIQSVVLKIWTSGHASDKAHAIGERLYDLLPQLPNLQSVLAIDVRMKNDQLARLCGGPNRALRRVTLRGCLFPFDTTVPYNIEELIIEEPASLQPTETAVVSLAYAAVGLINLSCIRILHLKTPVLVEQLIPQLVTEARFQALEELRISLCDQWPKQLTPLLHRCPKLVQLRLSATFDLARVHAGKLDTMIPRHIASIVIKHCKGVRQSRR